MASAVREVEGLSRWTGGHREDGDDHSRDEHLQCDGNPEAPTLRSTNGRAGCAAHHTDDESKKTAKRSAVWYYKPGKCPDDETNDDAGKDSCGRHGYIMD